MKWLLKAALHNTVSYAPYGERLTYVLQYRVLGTLPQSDAAFLRKVARAFQHFDTFLAHGPSRPAGQARFYEFGAGWDLVVQLAYYALGVERQTLVDIRPIMRLELVNDSIRKFERHRVALEREHGRALRSLGPASLTRVDELEQRFGMSYLAPRDARDTGLPGASFDFVSSTDTIEHIPEPDLLGILTECRRLLRPDGAISCRIDLEDHYSRVDGGLSRYNFLRFSDRTWRLLNSPLHYQSRLRYPDYLRITREAGFEIVSEGVSRPSVADLEALGRLRVAERFRRYPLEELGVKGMTIVARPSSA